jgi:hypothetical protein
MTSACWPYNSEVTVDANCFQEFVAGARAGGVLLYHSGPLDQEVLTGMGGALRRRLQEEGAHGAKARKVFAAFMEMAQNVVHYAAADPDGLGPFGSLAVVRDGAGFRVMCGNYLLTRQVPRVRARLEEVQAMDKDTVRVAYRRRLAAEGDGDPHSKGAGLGLLTMAANAKDPIEFRFVPEPPSEEPVTFLFLQAAI